MSEKEFNIVFSRRLRHYLSKYNMTQNELAKRLGVGSTSVYNWCNSIKTPRMDKVDAMCTIFKCKRSDFMDDKSDMDSFHIEESYNTLVYSHLYTLNMSIYNDNVTDLIVDDKATKKTVMLSDSEYKSLIDDARNYINYRFSMIVSDKIKRNDLYSAPSTEEQLKKIFHEADDMYLNAAHQRTDIDIPDDVDTSDDEFFD